MKMPSAAPITIASASPPQRRRAIADEFAVLEQIDPGRRHRAQRRQSERGDEAAARAGFPREREQEQREVSQQRRLHATPLRSHGGRGNGRLDHDARPVCALIASMRTRFQISSTLSVKPLFLKIAGSLLSNLVSTIALMRPGRADITATRSAR